MARTLQNFGVPTDSGASTGTGILQPKLNYRFRVQVAGFGGPIREYNRLHKTSYECNPSQSLTRVYSN